MFSRNLSLKLFENRDLLYEYLEKLDYPSIKQICSMYKDIYSTCSLDPHIGELIRRKRIEFRTDLLEKDIEPDSIIIVASIIGDVAVVDELIKRGYDPSVNNNLAIIDASKNGHLPVVNRLLQDQRVDPSARNNYAIRYASLKGYLPIVDRLLQDERVNPSDANNRAIINAIVRGHLSVVDRLLQDKRVDPVGFPANQATCIILLSYWRVKRDIYR